MKPMRMTALVSALMTNFSSASVHIKPKRKLPAILTAKVPHGKEPPDALLNIPPEIVPGQCAERAQ